MGNPATRHRARQAMRRRLRAQGLSPAEIEARVFAQYPATPPTPKRRTRRGRRSEAATERRAASREHINEAARLERLLKDDQANQARRLAEADRAQERREAETYARLSPDDRGYRPSPRDSLKTGMARATGATAKVAGRRNTITKWQYDEMEGTG